MFTRYTKTITMYFFLAVAMLFGLALWNIIPLNAAFIASVVIIVMAVSLIVKLHKDHNTVAQYIQQISLDRKHASQEVVLPVTTEELEKSLYKLKTNWESKKVVLETSLAESHVLFDTLPDILLMLNKELEIIKANHSAYIMFGSTILHKSLYEVIEQDKIENIVEELKKTGESKTFDLIFKSGEQEYDYKVRIEKFPVRMDSGVAYILILRDVTESRHARQLMKEFIANASHEIRTPLTSLIGFIETLRTVAKDDEGAREQFLKIMEEQARHLADLVNGLLSLSKIEMKENTLPVNYVKVREILENAIRKMEWMAADKDITIDHHIPASLPKIRGNESELLQVFINIISNAIKYSDDNTTISIKAITHNQGHVPESANRMVDYSKVISIAIKDQGEGIKEDDINKLTERFFRVDKARASNVTGTGLGLAIVKHTLNRHKGQLVVESQLGKGSVFTIYLPVQGS